VQMSFAYYADASDLNLIDGFDIINGREASTSGALARHIPTEYYYFIYMAGSRIISRLQHIFYIHKMDSPYQALTSEGAVLSDDIKTEKIVALLHNSKKPLFLEAHFMNTHGPTCYPAKRAFSASKNINTQEDWDSDFYDDCISEFDNSIGKIVRALESESLINDTVVIIGSDHGQRHTINRRIPLLFHFPFGRHAGTIKPNVQNLDIDPTIIDYLGLLKPEWMKGSSLIASPLPQRAILSVKPDACEILANGRWEVSGRTIPPFYQFGRIDVMTCDRWYELNLRKRAWSSGNVAGSTNRCSENDRISESDVDRLIISHLKQNGFDTSSLPERHMNSAESVAAKGSRTVAKPAS